MILFLSSIHDCPIGEDLRICPVSALSSMYFVLVFYFATLAYSRATMAPLMLCHTLNTAPGMVAMG